MVSFLAKFHKHIGVLVALTLAGSVFLLKDGIKINNSLDIWFVKNDSIYENYIDFRNRYSTDDVVAIYVHSGNIFSTDVLENMVSMCSQIDSISSVKNVFYLANAPYISASPLGPTATPLMSSIPGNKLELERLRSRIEKVPHYRKTLVDKNYSGFMVYVTLFSQNSDYYDPNALQSVKRIANTYFEQVYYGGIPVINQSLNDTANSESRRFSILSAITVTLLLLLFLRSGKYVSIAVLSVITPVVWLFGAYTFLGGHFNMITIVIPSILLITGMATSVHIINICHRFYFDGDLDPKKALEKALRYVFWPCTFTAATTMAGFFSLAASPIDGIKEVGILAAAGVGLVFICSFLVTSLAFMLLPPQKGIPLQRRNFSSRGSTVLRFFSKVNHKAPRLAIILLSVTITVSIPCIFMVEVGTNTFDYLDKSSAAYTDNFVIENSAGPFMPVEMLVTKDSSLNASDLHKLFEFQDSLKRSRIIDNVFSPLDIMAYMNQVMNNPKKHELPRGEGQTNWIKNLYLKNRRNTFQKYENENFSEMRISANTLVGSSKEYDVKQKNILKIFNEVIGSKRNITLSIRGYLPMYVAMNKHIIIGQVKTFSIAFLLILGLIVVCFRSFRLALIALFPNLFPVSLVIISMYLLKIPIDQSTALITCVILGITFDDSIHLIYSFRNFQKQGLSTATSVERALETTSSAMISTSIALFAGFTIIATTSSTSLLYFGLLCSIAVLGSLLGNVWLLPALLKRGTKKS